MKSPEYEWAMQSDWLTALTRSRSWTGNDRFSPNSSSPICVNAVRTSPPPFACETRTINNFCLLFSRSVGRSVVAEFLLHRIFFESVEMYFLWQWQDVLVWVSAVCVHTRLPGEYEWMNVDKMSGQMEPSRRRSRWTRDRGGRCYKVVRDVFNLFLRRRFFPLSFLCSDWLELDGDSIRGWNRNETKATLRVTLTQAHYNNCFAFTFALFQASKASVAHPRQHRPLLQTLLHAPSVSVRSAHCSMRTTHTRTSQKDCLTTESRTAQEARRRVEDTHQRTDSAGGPQLGFVCNVSV